MDGIRSVHKSLDYTVVEAIFHLRLDPLLIDPLTLIWFTFLTVTSRTRVLEFALHLNSVLSHILKTHPFCNLKFSNSGNAVGT